MITTPYLKPVYHYEKQRYGNNKYIHTPKLSKLILINLYGCFESGGIK